MTHIDSLVELFEELAETAPEEARAIVDFIRRDLERSNRPAPHEPTKIAAGD